MSGSNRMEGVGNWLPGMSQAEEVPARGSGHSERVRASGAASTRPQPESRKEASNDDVE